MSDATNQLDRFERNLDTYGADLELWPAGEKEAGLLALQSSERARMLHAEALELADVLLQVDRAREPVEPSAALLRNLAEIPLRHPRRKPEGRGMGWWPFTRSYGSALVLAAVAVLGVIVGRVAPETWGDEPSVPAWAALAGEDEAEELGWTSEDVEELSALAFGFDLEEDWSGEAAP